MKPVEIYTSDTCGYCHSAKDYFNQNNIQFVEHNISADASARKELIKKGYRSVPVIVIGTEEILGFDKEKISSLLGI
ncbi:glutaredoxin family protein [Clostridium thailandense]|uniref:Glutaredoxin family protein n=1 Tax=Clostridium thailandense TaxID=2794346 RepID=A0A949TNZ2_9CLOT|nr:glutaredoxin domain-containing protein [Clostridium thailandense]MBV7273932.1 glutaredoxin family protein [Clostridium thailandense]MCH5137214.1 glutaredoxin family protein [Clostridiaceae bacterium UIB06]